LSDFLPFRISEFSTYFGRSMTLHFWLLAVLKIQLQNAYAT
jgi:hypothetical protein